MNLKKLTRIIALFVMIALSSPSFAATNSTLRDSTADYVRAEQIMNRLTVIQSMDLSSLSPAERKDLRKELNGLNREARNSGNTGIYLSIGAIIVIILLLILLLK